MSGFGECGCCGDLPQNIEWRRGRALHIRHGFNLAETFNDWVFNSLGFNISGCAPPEDQCSQAWLKLTITDKWTCNAPTEEWWVSKGGDVDGKQEYTRSPFYNLNRSTRTMWGYDQFITGNAAFIRNKNGTADVPNLGAGNSPIDYAELRCSMPTPSSWTIEGTVHLLGGPEITGYRSIELKDQYEDNMLKAHVDALLSSISLAQLPFSQGEPGSNLDAYYSTEQGNIVQVNGPLFWSTSADLPNLQGSTEYAAGFIIYAAPGTIWNYLGGSFDACARKTEYRLPANTFTRKATTLYPKGACRAFDPPHPCQNLTIDTAPGVIIPINPRRSGSGGLEEGAIVANFDHQPRCP